MRRVWGAVRGPVSAMLVIAILARLLLPLPALAKNEAAVFDAARRITLCLPSGKPVPGDGEEIPEVMEGVHCLLCRLPDADLGAPPDLRMLPEPAWTVTVPMVPDRQSPSAKPLPRGPPPARAPPVLLILD